MTPNRSEADSFYVSWFCHDQSVQTDVTVRVHAGELQDVVPGKSAGARDFRSLALVDGLVNAHTHLEFSQHQQPIPTTGRFTDWIRRVVAYRREHATATGSAIRAGIEESLRAGTTLIGDIATVGWTPEDYAIAGFHGVVFQEVLGQSPDRIEQQRQLARSVTGDSAVLRRGLSPHAPYSTHLDLVDEVVELSRTSQLPLAMHLAETRSELELLSAQSGEFRELLIDFGIWNDRLFSPKRRPMEYLRILARAPRCLIIHGNYLDDEELKFLATQPQMSLVYCPRTHAAFGHAPHPWQKLIAWGGNVAIGTDSRASNPDLSLFAELQFLAANSPNISHLDLLALGSCHGRAALGMTPQETANRANFTLIRPGGTRSGELKRDLFSSQSRVCGTMIDGIWFHLEQLT